MRYDKYSIHEEQIKEIGIYYIGILFWIVLVFIGTMTLQFLEEVIYVSASIFTILIVTHVILYRISYRFKYKYASFYYFLQSSVIFISAFIMPHGSPIVLVGLIPILIAESIHYFESSFKVLLAVILLYIPYSVAIATNYGVHELPFFLPILFFIVAISAFYSIHHAKQMKAWSRMQYYISELEAANQKIEELTIINERKRLARDLHDTLAQGLAGLIMKLEAIDVYVQQGNQDKSRQIIRDSMKQARNALRDARGAIDDLRSEAVSEINFVMEVENEIIRFENATSVDVTSSMQTIPPLTDVIRRHGIFIISESLTNIAKHAHASAVEVEISKDQKDLYIRITDNGAGFDTNSISEKHGHYGLIGMYERVRILNGTLNISSQKEIGTKVRIEIPLAQDGVEDEK
ncbi:hypothetical protein CR203_20280 [Salipaludibacillus neizhouensis]|uniref:histidine kinase n=1 Tax=Salipaludibacillus neizhouensis TaxID=885475 RepID=A0A3A9K3T5_9BACI|nr:sensor histidine kinase [Salipaludibacillus neizhouensis]RKL65540.1 hypothetical protein CR203_20280 [Salipaludibacillus neizhouensis]